MSLELPYKLIALTVARVNQGGNAGRGQYFFDFVPNPLVIDEKESLLSFELSDDTPSQFLIADMVSSDSLGMLGTPEIGASQRWARVPISNQRAYLMQVALLISDEKTGEVFVCDPQVICRPPPRPSGT